MSTLPPLVQDFVLHLGEMGSRWGMTRTVGQIYALLFVSPRPLCADDIVAALEISRSNVSMSLRELQSWNLLVMKPRHGDRREFFTTPDDVWEILRILAEERRRREITPTLATLDTLLARHADTDDERFAQLRMEQMHALIAQLTGWYDDVKGLDNTHLSRLLSLGATVMKLLGKRDRGAGRGKPVEEQGA